MPRRNNQVSNSALGLAWLLCMPLFGWLGYKCLEVDFLRPLGWMFILFALLPIAILALIFLWMMIPKANHDAVSKSSGVDPNILANLQLVHSARRKVVEVMDKHIETLARRRIALVSIDHYGVVKAEGWKKEVQYFVDTVVRPALTVEEANAIAARMNETFQELVEDRVARRSDDIEAALDFEAVDSPLAFERWCAKILGTKGWTATITKASGDQGADVLARKNDYSVILQCKLYSSPVGNKAVQEAFAAQRHYLTRKSAVVTNAEFTRSARELAASTKVLLLHYSDLSRIDDFIEDQAER